MVVKSLGRSLALLMALPSAAFALGLGDIHLRSPLNAPLDAEIELVDATPEELQSLKAQIASRDTFTRYGLDYPVYLSNIQVRTTRGPDGKQLITLRSTDSITEPFITLLVEVNWARGRLVREYTMLMDPPVYTPAQTPASNAPVAAPTTGAAVREGAIARKDDAETGSADSASAAPAADSSASAGTATGSQPVASGSQPVVSSHDPGGTHVVRAGETLSGIAAGTSGSALNSAQARSWMLAIYQANPGAFDKNMNVLRSGAVLRIPDSAAAAAISPSEANGEIRRQYAAWRSSASPGSSSDAAAGAPGHLRLVTPSETASSGAAGATGNARALESRVKELEGELSESKRLLEMRNAELAQLQSRLQSGPNAPAAHTPPTAAPPATAPSTPASAAATKPVETVPPVQSAAPPPATATNAAPPAPAVTPAVTPAAAAGASAARAHRPPVTAAAEPRGSILDTLKGLWWAIALVVLALLALLGLRSWRARRQSAFDDSLGRLAVAGANSMDRGFAPNEAGSGRLGARGDDAFLVEESGVQQRPRTAAAGAAAAAKQVASDETVSSETAINLDQGDPLAEADFHMAYGLYDQAADLIKIAISREPARRDLKLKLLEVFFVWGNKEQFLQSARELAATRDQAAPGEWEKILIMGKQLAPEDPLFAGEGAVSGATAGGVDLDLEGGESRVDFDLLGDPVAGQAAGVDLDIGSALGHADASAEAATGSTDRSFALGGSPGATTTRQMTQKMSPDHEPMIAEFGADAEAPTIEQPGFSPSEHPTMRQKVAMAMRKSHSGEQTAEVAIDDLGLDLGTLDTLDQPGLSSSEAPTLVAGLDEHSRKVMADAEHRATVDGTQTVEHQISATGAWRMDANELEATLGKKVSNGHAGPAFDSSATARLAALSSRDVDFDLGDVDADGSHTTPRSTNGSGLDLDVGTATVPDTAFASTQKLPADDLALPDLEPVTMSEVGTKLDLARAYMDMGDPEGARNILEEVLHEGSVAQKQEAQRLMESLPG